jgi:hypothetical protein
MRGGEAEITAATCRRTVRGRGRCERIDEAVHTRAARWRPVKPVEGVEQVAGAELRPQSCEGVRTRDCVQANVGAERQHRAALSWLERECLLELGERGPVGSESIGICASRRGDRKTVRRKSDLIPNVGLGNAACERFCA